MAWNRLKQFVSEAKTLTESSLFNFKVTRSKSVPKNGQIKHEVLVRIPNDIN